MYILTVDSAGETTRLVGIYPSLDAAHSAAASLFERTYGFVLAESWTEEATGVWGIWADHDEASFTLSWCNPGEALMDRL